jgi:AraC-like DNA-binding protein
MVGIDVVLIYHVRRHLVARRVPRVAGSVLVGERALLERAAQGVMSISIVFARELLAQAQQSGGDTDALLRRCGLEPERLSDCNAVLSLEEHCALAGEVMALTNDPGLGLTIGASAPSRMLQVMGLLISSCRTLRQAFETFRQYAALLDDGPRWELEESGDMARFTCVPAFQLGAFTRAAMEFSLVMTLRIGQQFVGTSARPLHVQCQHAEPEYGQRYRDLFCCPVHFSQPRYALVFPRAYLDREQHHGDAIMHAELARIADEMLIARTRVTRLSERVRVHIRQDPRFWESDQQGMASRLGLSLRTLRRRLRNEGTSLSGLRQQARCHAACESLRRIDGSVRRTAELVGFSEVSAFHRAFKRWTGRTPAEYRARSGNLQP